MALVDVDGNPVEQVPGETVLKEVVDNDPLVELQVSIYEDSPYDMVNFPTRMRQLRWRKGQVIRQSEWDSEFVAPTITGIEPDEGPEAGGTSVTITGTNFTMHTTVTVDGADATDIVVINPMKLTAKTPAGSAGAVDVVVATTGGSATLEAGFTYLGD